MKAREICEKMYKKLKRDVGSTIGSVHVSYAEEARRDTNVVIRNLVGRRKKRERNLRPKSNLEKIVR